MAIGAGPNPNLVSCQVTGDMHLPLLLSKSYVALGVKAAALLRISTFLHRFSQHYKRHFRGPVCL